MNTEDTTTDTTRRTDLRTVEPHYSASDVYAALGCPYPGESGLRLTNRTHIFYNLSGQDIEQAREQRPSGETGVGLPVSSADVGISASTSDSAVAGDRRAGFSSEESDENDARNDRTNGGEEHRTVTDSERLREVDP